MNISGFFYRFATPKFLLVNIIIIILFSVIYYVKESFEVYGKIQRFNTPIMKKSVFKSVSNHIPVIDNETLGDDSMSSKVLKGAQNVISHALIYSTLL